eukprot:GGOE01042938.1.p1 GENE.GGOE01042938.1~~GGOE01042938.1.p1  ORF type:complete len:549 (+),score=174.54 GGOE01042938.1:79-1725(+)
MNMLLVWLALLCCGILLPTSRADLLVHEHLRKLHNPEQIRRMSAPLYSDGTDVDPLARTPQETETWYAEVAKFWSEANPSVAAMVEEGGSENSLPELEESLRFLEGYFPPAGKKDRLALDLGAGVGRVTKGLLLKLAGAVDLVDQEPRLLRAARSLLGPQPYPFDALNPKGRYFDSKLQDFNPQEAAYDLVCLEWTASYLTDADLIFLLHRVRRALQPQGLLFLKDSILKGGTHAQKVGLRHMRPHALYEALFQRAGLYMVAKGEHGVLPEAHTNRLGMYLVGKYPVMFIPSETGEQLPLMGIDSESGQHFYSMAGMWEEESKSKQWYTHVKEYWDSREAKVNNPAIAAVDLEESATFLQPFFPAGERFKRRALDLGAGVGRVAQGVLLKFVYTVDLVDQGAHFLREARNRLGTRNLNGQYVQAAVQDVDIPAGHYDLICFQYTALYLGDDELLQTLKRCGPGLKEKGILFFKDNLPSNPAKFQVNRDSGFNIFRTEEHYRHLFRQAGLTIVKEALQDKWLEDANKVKMFALRPTEYWRPPSGDEDDN